MVRKKKITNQWLKYIFNKAHVCCVPCDSFIASCYITIPLAREVMFFTRYKKKRTALLKTDCGRRIIVGSLFYRSIYPSFSLFLFCWKSKSAVTRGVARAMRGDEGWRGATRGDAAWSDRPHSAFSEAAEYQEFLRRAEKGQRTWPERTMPGGF